MSDLDKTANTERTPVDVDELLRNIRNQFYTEAPLKKFLQDRNVLLLAVTWPALWLKERGVTWSGERYFQVLYDLLQQIKRHGATAQIRANEQTLDTLAQAHRVLAIQRRRPKAPKTDDLQGDLF